MNIMLLWHMHQPYYVNPLTLTAKMPWVRLHASKGYLDMIDLVTAQSGLRVNFNFTPVLVRQILELAENRVQDEWELLSRKPAVLLSGEDRRHLLENFFKIHWDNLVRPFPRYAELLAKRGYSYKLEELDSISRRFSDADFRDLQTLYNLHWCGFSALKRFPQLAELKARGRDYTEEEKHQVLDAQHSILRLILGLYRKAEEEGQIEITTTPYFHPIMPLVYDTQIARRCQPNSPLPAPFSAPEDVRSQLRLAQELHLQTFGKKARGVWPSEGSVCPEIVPLLVEAGFEYFFTDEGNLFKSLELDSAWNHHEISHLTLFQGWQIRSGESTIKALFRERPLSDFIGFDAARNETSRSVDHLIAHLKNIAEAAPADDRVVSLILDGENAWEAFPDSGEAFLTSFYRALQQTPSLQTTRAGDFFSSHAPKAETSHLHSGSWIRSDFDIWIGDPEENKAWEFIKQTRNFLTHHLEEKTISPTLAEQAWWEIYAAEGSDWFWWYGPDFTIDTDFLFDELFRLHLQNVYRLMGVEPPVPLYLPICQPTLESVSFTVPTRLISPSLTGTSEERFFDWVGAGSIGMSAQQTAMYQSDRIGEKIMFGFSSDHFFLRLRFRRRPDSIAVRFVQPKSMKIVVPDPEQSEAALTAEISLDEIHFQPHEQTHLIVARWGEGLLLALPRAMLGLENGASATFFVELMENGLQRERYPERGAVDILSPGLHFEAEQWFI